MADPGDVRRTGEPRLNFITDGMTYMYVSMYVCMHVCKLCIYVLCVYIQTTEAALPAIMPKQKKLPNECDRGNAGGEETEKWRE